ncbi:MAG TPA: hypothetical protein VLX91_03895, partial [Candidatus Acidoferrales bacterium]|nr:hypothetical protein [Candidatus Acidoferrales bacterium]
FTLIGKTFLRNIVAAVIFLVIPIILLIIAANSFYSSIADMVLPSNGSLIHEQPGSPFMLQFFGEMALFFVAILILALGTLLAEITISYTVGKEMLGEEVGLNEAMKETFYMKWLYGIGQAALKLLIIGGGTAVVGFFLSTFAVVIDSGVVFGILVALFLIAGVPVIIYLAYRWYFSLTAVAVESLSPLDALRQSWFLVKENWWRTFGILLLLTILSQFAISIVSLPITFGSMWSFYRGIFTAIGNSGGEPDPQIIHQAMKSLGPGVGIAIGISSLFSLLVTPVFTVVMYFDLRARKHDLPGMQAPPPIDIQNTPPEIIQ